MARRSSRRIYAASATTAQQVGAGHRRLRRAAEHARCWASDSRKIATSGPVSTSARSVLTEAFHVVCTCAHVGGAALDAADESSARSHFVAALGDFLGSGLAVFLNGRERLCDEFGEDLTKRQAPLLRLLTEPLKRFWGEVLEVRVHFLIVAQAVTWGQGSPCAGNEAKGSSEGKRGIGVLPSSPRRQVLEEHVEILLAEFLGPVVKELLWPTEALVSDRRFGDEKSSAKSDSFPALVESTASISGLDDDSHIGEECHRAIPLREVPTGDLGLRSELRDCQVLLWGVLLLSLVERSKEIARSEAV